MNTNKGWIGVDLDGTLARYEGWQGSGHIGEPLTPMVEQVKAWLAAGEDVRIFTARVGPQKDVNETIRARSAIEAWCETQFGKALPITATKDFSMKALCDDRACQMVPNTGESLADVIRRVLLAISEGRTEEVTADLATLMQA